MRKISLKVIAIILVLTIITMTLPLTAFAYAAALTDNTDSSAQSEETTQNSNQTASAETDDNEDIFELINLREENVKHFHLDDGTYIASQYDQAVHYLDENGDWQDIDNTLYDNGSDISTSNARVKFAKKITGNGDIFTLHENNRKITWGLEGAIKKTPGVAVNIQTEHDESATTLQKMLTLDKLSSKVVYYDILPGVDIEYILESNNIKENIIVKQKSDTYSYTFTLKLNNLTAQMDDDGNVIISDAHSGEQVYVIPAPIVYDANHVYAPTDKASYSLTSSGNGKYQLTVTADTEWMNDSQRAYPVVVDPTTHTGNSGITNIYVENPAVNADNSDWDTFLKMSQNTRIYWKTTNLPTLPSSAYIVKAEFIMQRDEGQAGYVGIYPITSAWDSSLTWGNTTAGLFSDNMLDYQYVVPDTDDGDYSNGGLFSWDITELYTDWDSDEVANYGVGLKIADGTTATGTAWFCGYNSICGVLCYPRLTVQYKDMKGLESYWTYSSQDIGFAGTGHVNLATGQVVLEKPLLSTTDFLLPFTPTLVYDSSIANLDFQLPNVQTIYGTTYTPVGFKLNIHETIVFKTYVNESGDTKTMYILSDSDGTEHYFLPDMVDNTEIYYDEDGLQLALEVDSENNIITITDNSQTCRTYSARTSANWYLSSITDAFGNKIVFSFDSGRPSMVSLVPNSSGQIDFLHMAYNASGRLYAIWNPTAKEALILRYSSTPTGELTTTNELYLRQIQYITSGSEIDKDALSTFYQGNSSSGLTVQATANYTYNSNGYLTKARDELSGYDITYGYRGSNTKVWKITEHGHYATSESATESATEPTTGLANVLTYKAYHTQVRTPGADDVYSNADDLYIRYIFDTEGRVKSVYSMDSEGNLIGATSGEYETQENIKNNLKPTVSLSGSPANLLLNGNFEKSTYWTFNGNVSRHYKGDIQDLYKYCAKFDVQANNTSYIAQKVNLPTGDYTLSMKVNTQNCDNVSARVKVTSFSGVTMLDEDMPLNDLDSLDDEVSFTFENLYEKFEVRIEVTGGAGVSQDAAVIIDEVMLEQGIGSSRYNLVQMGSFTESNVNAAWTPQSVGTTYWKDQTGSLTTSATTAPFDTAGMVSGTAAEKYIEQTIYSSSASSSASSEITFSDHRFIVSGYGKAIGASPSGKFGIRVDVTYYEMQNASEDTTNKESFEFNFLTNCEDWQFVCGDFTTAPRQIKSIKVVCVYTDPSGGTAYFDDVCVIELNTNERVLNTYYENGLLRTRESYGYEEYYEYNDKKQVTLVANNQGQLTEYVYDNDGVTLQEKIKYEFYNTDSSSTIYPYLTPNPDAIITKTEKSVSAYSYNNYGQLEVVDECSDEIWMTSSSTYNITSGSPIFGCKISDEDTLGRTTKYYYDQTNGRLLATVNHSAGTGTCYTYDAIGNMTSALPVTNVTATSYSPATNSENVTYTYNEHNQLSSITTATTTYNFSYTPYGDSAAVSVEGNQIVNYEYTHNSGKLSAINYANGASVWYEYDTLDNISEIWYTENEESVLAYTYEYTKYGQLSRFDNLLTGRSTVYTYDTSGRLVGITEFDTSDSEGDWDVSISYDDQSRQSSVSYTFPYLVGANDSVYYTDYSYNYNNDGSLNTFGVRTPGTSTPDEGESTTGMSGSYVYDDLDRVISRSQDYEASDQIAFSNYTAYTYYNDGTYDSPLVHTYMTTMSPYANGSSSYAMYTYTYDDNNNITKITLSDGTEYRYVYDDLGQLIREDCPTDGNTHIYTYDNAGNMMTHNVYHLTAEGVEPTALTDSYLYGYDSNWGDQLTFINGHTITYDEIGNPLSYYNGQSYTFSWQNGRELAFAQKGTDNVIYEYNDQGIRISKNVNGTKHTYQLDGSRIISESWGDEILIYLYDAEGSPVGMQSRYAGYSEGKCDTFWFEKNLQGDIVAIYDENGIKLVSYRYDAWGNFTTIYHNGGADTVADWNPFKYRGYYYDEETGFYYLNSRYYDPQIRRFINADSQLNTSLGILGLNQFSYCLNNPANMADDGGNKPGDLFDTMDQAAKDFAEYINAKSIAEDCEYGSFIYKKTTWETQTVVYYNPNIFGDNFLSRFWNRVFGGGVAKVVKKRVKVTQYSYVEPNKGTSHSVSIPFNWFGLKNKVAEIHTHGAYSPGYNNDNFSSVDFNKWINYLVTPLGTVRKYNPANGSDIIIYRNAPYDPNHPERR